MTLWFKYVLSRDMTQRDDTNNNGCKFPTLFCHHFKRLLSNDVSAEENGKNEVNNTQNHRDNTRKKPIEHFRK